MDYKFKNYASKDTNNSEKATHEMREINLIKGSYLDYTHTHTHTLSINLRATKKYLFKNRQRVDISLKIHKWPISL